MPLWLSLIILGWLVSLLLGLRFGSLTGWKRGLLVFCGVFTAVLLLVFHRTEEATPVPSLPSQAPPTPQNIGLADLQQLITAHPIMQQRGLAWTNRSIAASLERKGLLERGDRLEIEAFDRKTRAQLAEEQRVTRDAVVSNLSQRIAQLAKERRLDAVFDCSNPVYPLPLVVQAPGWTNLTEAILRELKP